MKKLSLLLVLVVALFSCKATVEGETSTWKDNQKKIKDLQDTYPAFSSVLAEEQKNAQQKWDEASKVSDQKEKAKKMSEANYTFNQGFVYDLGVLQTEIEKVTQQNEELTTVIDEEELGISESEEEDAITASGEAKVALVAVAGILSTGDKSVAQATKTIKEANTKLVDIEKKLGSSMRVINDSKKSGKTTKKAKKKSTKDKTEKEEKTTKKKSETKSEDKSEEKTEKKPKKKVEKKTETK